MRYLLSYFAPRSGLENAAEKLDQRSAKNELTGCVNYTGTRDKDGYGLISLGRTQKWRAHRLSYSVFNGEIPDGVMVRHKCDNPGCVNPDHLEIGDAASNNLDRVSRGRSNTGENNGQNKITEIEVSIIKRSNAAAGVLSEVLGISAAQVRRIRNGEQWQNIERDFEIPEWADRIANRIDALPS